MVSHTVIASLFKTIVLPLPLMFKTKTDCPGDQRYVDLKPHLFSCLLYDLNVYLPHQICLSHSGYLNENVPVDVYLNVRLNCSILTPPVK